METGKTTPPAREASIDLPSDVETVIRRRFDAPAEQVFAAWTTPEYVRRWWPSPGTMVTACDIDLRPGGSWRWALTSPDGTTEIAFSGRYQEIDPPRRLVYSEMYEAMPNQASSVTLSFDEVDGVTTLTTVMRYQSKEHRDEHLRSGVEPGIEHAYARIEEILSVSARREI